MDGTGMRHAARALGLGVATVLASALLGSLVLLLILAIPEMPPARVGSAADMALSLLFFALVVSTPFIALGLILIGLPVDYVLRRVEIRSPVAYAACGMLGGLILGAVIVHDNAWDLGNFGLISMGYGLATSLVFWTLFRRWRPAGDEA
jgi:hypothetical protein